MSPLAFGWTGFGILLLFLALRIPIAASLLLSGLIGLFSLNFSMSGDAALAFNSVMSLLARTPYSFIASFSLVAIPIFILMGAVAFHSGATSEAYAAARAWIGNWRGGLAQATIIACAVFAAISGSSMASASAMGRIAVPEMLKYRYDKSLATGTVAVGGTLGALIPPSILLVLYGVFAEESIGRLLVAGIVPGLLTALSYMIVIWLRVRFRPELAPSANIRMPLRQKMRSSLGATQLLLIFTLMIGVLYTGIATATEAAVVGATGTILLGLLRGRLSRAQFADALLETVKTTSMIFAIAIGAKVFVSFIALTGIAPAMASWVSGLGAHPAVVLIGLTVVYLILGMFLDPLGILLLTLPIALPIVLALGYDSVWFGVLLVKYIEIGCITPPVGLNVFVLKAAIGDTVRLETIFRGIGWFLIADIIVVALMIIFPEMVTFLPDMMLGGY
ncbi:TRAP transporter large permease [Paracoccus sp. S1E-3]|uniref:TRAP transporter large permease n=1 Tax=Paracoccus sp. S1E-3 TaxID=2756130 RepID=UPI0015EE5191|nr:TRAP transporter large permease [Paracoccus sp. S1E-3]MBA4489597.1 TRAP transporter large permease [Paracoccus sp. S1E-3]